MERQLSQEQKDSKNAKIAASYKATSLRRKQQKCSVIQLKIVNNKLNAQQKEALERVFLEAKWIYNEALSQGIVGYSAGKTVEVKTPQGFEIRDLTTIGSQMKQSVVSGLKSSMKTLSSAKKSGRRIGKLKFISDYTSLDLKQHGTTHKFFLSSNQKTGKINSIGKARVQNIPGKLPVIGLEQLGNKEISNAKLVKKASGFYLHVTCWTDKKDVVDNYQPNTKIGVDMGVSSHIILSDGQKWNVLIGESDQLKRLQKRLAKQKKGSNNYYKTIHKIHRCYEKMNNQKNDKANKIVAQLTNHETVYFQDEMLPQWKVRFGKQTHHSILGRVKNKLITHPRTVMLKKSVATTQFCPQCRHKTKHDLSARQYNCKFCGYNNPDRDIHAAQNMIILGENPKLPLGQRDVKPVEKKSDLLLSKHSSVKQEANSL